MYLVNDIRMADRLPSPAAFAPLAPSVSTVLSNLLSNLLSYRLSPPRLSLLDLVLVVEAVPLLALFSDEKVLLKKLPMADPENLREKVVLIARMAFLN